MQDSRRRSQATSRRRCPRNATVEPKRRLVLRIGQLTVSLGGGQAMPCGRSQGSQGRHIDRQALFGRPKTYLAFFDLIDGTNKVLADPSVPDSFRSRLSVLDFVRSLPQHRYMTRKNGMNLSKSRMNSAKNGRKLPSQSHSRIRPAFGMADPGPVNWCDGRPSDGKTGPHRAAHLKEHCKCHAKV